VTGRTGGTVTLVLGGTRSGKSMVAERFTAEAAGAAGTGVTYVATLKAGDDEMQRRVAAHRARRPPEWATAELGDPGDLPPLVSGLPGTVLVDSLGTWLATSPDLAVDTPALVAALASRRGPTVVVSEEVGLAVHPSTAVGRAFVDALGSLNQAVAAAADRVVLVVAGRVLEL
jgi:adenosylcobinamide kinase / adenosylcobinamide-phosphate guanylyltransferase